MMGDKYETNEGARHHQEGRLWLRDAWIQRTNKEKQLLRDRETHYGKTYIKRRRRRDGKEMEGDMMGDPLRNDGRQTWREADVSRTGGNTLWGRIESPKHKLLARSINCLRDNFKIAMFLAQIQSQQPNSVSKSLRCYVPCVALLQHHRHFLQHSRGNWDWQMSGSGSWPWLRNGRVAPPNQKTRRLEWVTPK